MKWAKSSKSSLTSLATVMLFFLSNIQDLLPRYFSLIDSCTSVVSSCCVSLIRFLKKDSLLPAFSMNAALAEFSVACIKHVVVVWNEFIFYHQALDNFKNGIFKLLCTLISNVINQIFQFSFPLLDFG